MDGALVIRVARKTPKDVFFGVLATITVSLGAFSLSAQRVRSPQPPGGCREQMSQAILAHARSDCLGAHHLDRLWRVGPRLPTAAATTTARCAR